jgi:hypothetical protein
MTMMMRPPAAETVTVPAAAAAGQEWVFTFGSDHKLLIGLDPAGYVEGCGVSLAHRYVRMRGTREATRENFTAMFGPMFCEQYPAGAGRTKEMILRCDLTELVVWA